MFFFFLMEGWYIFRYLLYLAIDEWFMFNGRLELVGINIKHGNHSCLDKCCRRPYGSAAAMVSLITMCSGSPDPELIRLIFP